ncbi:beta-glucosidase BglX [Candidatus Bacteroides intestinigallinarum]|uniref:beta-glucosidase BglX n=1 Tax=Candidatus Bacteroides intestinigallinarum TaxID=2838470 RepID=UPI00216608BC|nr:beta-glucosidase BglX [Candidatus Bacteroides intestinigallinarum]MCS3200725.1 beta-glucosidase BglX [Candidatus Bacteroides intestinigallinarum]
MSCFTLTAFGQGGNSIEKRIDELVSQMTLQEKIGQMNQLTGMGLSKNMKESVKTGKVGTILNELNVEVVNELQRIAVEESRLHIPLIVARDVIHGFKTIFPIPLGQAASWNPEVAEEGARVAAMEASATGIRWTFAPMIDVSRDPRWGRIAESCGEDPYLTSMMGVAMVKGFQGTDLSAPTSIAACAKHFAAYGASESGKDYNTTWIPEVLLRDVYLPPFEAAAKAGAATFMCSFNDINGIPSSGNPYLNHQILRNEWNYDGVLVSDWGSIQQMIPHGFCADLKEAAMKAANASVDIDMMGYAYTKHLEDLVASGKVSEKTIDEAVRNILRLKFRLGLFDNPYTKVEKKLPYYTAESLAKAKRAAMESAVLLKNNGVLPLKKEIKTIAVVGPLADAPADQLGTWCFDAEPERAVTPLTALRDLYGKQVKIVAEPGLQYSRDRSEEGIAKAVKTAEQADVILAFVGEEAILSGEARCRADIGLPGKQTELLAALKQTGKPVVMIVMAGRPLTIARETEMADGILYAFHGGTMAGPALADLIFGQATPSGKLPVTIPRMVGQIPIYYAHKNTGRPASNITLMDDIEIGAKQTSIGFTSYHLDAGDGPLFPFGYGLSYTTFRYGDVKLSSGKLKGDETLTVTCDITNIGNCDASEVVQLYIRDRVASLIRPVRELKGFKKVFMKAGETHTVSFQLSASDLAFWHDAKVKKAEAGEFLVWVSTDSQTGTPVRFLYEE